MTARMNRLFLLGILTSCSLVACGGRDGEDGVASGDALCSIPPDRDLEVTKVVYATGVNLGVSDKVMLAGFETGWVESHMNDLACGDRDSLGVFQQRASWGSAEQRIDVGYAST